MKKFLSVIFAVILVCASLFGCSNSEAAGTNPEETPSAEAQTLDIIVYDRGNDATYWNYIVSAFEAENTGVKIKATVTKDAAYELRDRILAGDSPDFVFLPSNEESGVTEALVKDKALASISDVAQAVSGLALSGVFDNTACEPYEDGETYLAPLFFETEGMIYNKEMLSQNGWSLPKTWDEFISLAKACDEKKTAIFAYSGAEPSEFVNVFAAALEPAAGAETMNMLFACDKEAWGNENIKTFVQKIEGITDLVAAKSSTKSRADAVSELKDGNVLFISGSQSDLKELNGDSSDKYGFTAYPKLGAEGETVSLVSFSEMYILGDSENVELAKKFMIFLYGDAAAKIAAENLGEVPPVQKIAELAAQYELGAEEEAIYPSIGTSAFCAAFKTKTADNDTLSDEFCNLVVSVFKGDVTSDDFSEKMLEYIDEY